MKVFISWSGDYSREVAEQLSAWIPSVIQSVETFYSPNDIGKGENWSNRLSSELENCSFGIICLTPENVMSPWINFEAGALAKNMDSRLSALMLGIGPSDIEGPLSQFQNTQFEATDFFKLIQAINNATEKPVNSSYLKEIFHAMWPRLDQGIQPIMQKYTTPPTTDPNHPLTLKKHKHYMRFEVYNNGDVVYQSDEIGAILFPDGHEEFSGLFNATAIQVIKAYPKINDFISVMYHRGCEAVGEEKCDEIFLNFVEYDTRVVHFGIKIFPDDSNPNMLQYSYIDWTESDNIFIDGDDWMK